MAAKSTAVRVLHISTARGWRGGEQQIAYLMRGLRERGLAQRLVAVEGEPLAQKMRSEGFTVVERRKGSGLDPAFAREIVRAARDFSAQVLHTHDSHGHRFAIWAHRYGGLSARLVVHRRVDFPVGATYWSHRKYNYPGISTIICISEAIRQVVARTVQQSSKLRVIPSAVDPERFAQGADGRLRREFQLAPHIKLVGNVAALVGHKDYFTFLDTAAQVLQTEKEVRFFIIGDGALAEPLRDYAREKGIADAVLFTGFRRDIQAVLPELDLLLFPSEMEGLGTTILDAYAAGVPVVATRAGGIPELVLEGRTAYLADVKQASELARHVIRLLHHPEEARRLTHAARKHLQQHFTYQKMAKAVEQVYDAALAGPSGRIK